MPLFTTKHFWMQSTGRKVDLKVAKQSEENEDKQKNCFLNCPTMVLEGCIVNSCNVIGFDNIVTFFFSTLVSEAFFNDSTEETSTILGMS